jgi:hypothetical protein
MNPSLPDLTGKFKILLSSEGTTKAVLVHRRRERQLDFKSPVEALNWSRANGAVFIHVPSASVKDN